MAASALKSSPVRLNHLLRVLARGIRQFSSAQHARYLFGALFANDSADRGPRAAVAFFLLDHKMVISKRCDLREVGYTEHLMGPRQRFQLLANRLSSAASNAGIDFVEHHGALGSTLGGGAGAGGFRGR